MYDQMDFKQDINILQICLCRATKAIGKRLDCQVVSKYKLISVP